MMLDLLPPQTDYGWQLDIHDGTKTQTSDTLAKREKRSHGQDDIRRAFQLGPFQA